MKAKFHVLEGNYINGDIDVTERRLHNSVMEKVRSHIIDIETVPKNGWYVDISSFKYEFNFSEEETEFIDYSQLTLMKVKGHVLYNGYLEIWIKDVF